MAKKKNKPAVDPALAPAEAASPSVWAGLRFYAFVLGLVIVFLAGLVAFNRWGAEQLRDDPRYQFPFRKIECTWPEGMKREEFLDEVQYLSRLPDKIFLLDVNLHERLGKAFKMHPWVEDAASEFNKSQAPPRVVVRLTFRRPVLAVPIKGESAPRAVDGRGVLLPKSASTVGLPVFEGEAAAPKSPAGQPWGDPKIETRAREIHAKSRPLSNSK